MDKKKYTCVEKEDFVILSILEKKNIGSKKIYYLLKIRDNNHTYYTCCTNKGFKNVGSTEIVKYSEPIVGDFLVSSNCTGFLSKKQAEKYYRERVL